MVSNLYVTRSGTGWQKLMPQMIKSSSNQFKARSCTTCQKKVQQSGRRRQAIRCNSEYRLKIKTAYTASAQYRYKLYIEKLVLLPQANITQPPFYFVCRSESLQCCAHLLAYLHSACLSFLDLCERSLQASVNPYLRHTSGGT